MPHELVVREGWRLATLVARSTAMAFEPDQLDKRDAREVRAIVPIARLINERYLRLRRDGLEHIERVAAEPVLFVSNHNAGIRAPDLTYTLATLWEALGSETPLYALAHDFVMRQLTPLGRLLQRIGAVRALPENELPVLDRGGSLV